MFKPVKLLAILLGTFLVLSCDDDKDVTPEDQLPTEFSELTVEQNKANLESNGLELVDNMEQLKNSAGVKTSISFSHFLSSADLPEVGRKATSLQPVDLIRALANFGQGKGSVTEVLSSFRSKQSEPEPETAQEIFDTYEGVFTYNAAENTWTHTESDNGKIVFRFPSTKEGTTNDAEFAIYGYESVTVNNPELEYDGDLPTALQADLTVSGTKHISYSFAASYQSNGEPTAVETILTINAFKFTVAVVNATSEVGVDYSLVHADKNLVAFGVGATGNFTSSNIEQSEGPGSVVNTAQAYVQLMNIRIAGEVNVKGLDDGLSNGDLSIEEEADVWNANTTLVVFYADSKKIIADTEFYGTEESETYSYCWDMNNDGQQTPDECQEFTDVHENLEIRLVFADGSKSDLETYTDVGFEDIQDEIEAFMDDLDADLD